MSKILIVDSHKGTAKLPSNLHTLNAKVLADELGADLIWSYPNVNGNVQKDYDVIVFNHASHYSYVDYEWVKESPRAKLFYITNEYNLGEPRALWMAIKRDGRDYAVIANHDAKPSKIVTKYTNAWHNLNINSLVFKNTTPTCFLDKKGCIYYGSFRKGREKYFKKYLDGLTVSTHSKNRDKFSALGITPNYINRVDWTRDGLKPYKTSLYIEDEVTHNNFNHLANRFYESLNYNVVPIFSSECENTIEKSSIRIPKEYIISSPTELIKKTNNLPKDYVVQLVSWREQARKERKEVLERLKNIITS